MLVALVKKNYALGNLHSQACVCFCLGVRWFVSFVFRTYFWGMPSLVKNLCDKMARGALFGRFFGEGLDAGGMCAGEATVGRVLSFCCGLVSL